MIRIKKSIKNYSNIFLCSDTHYGHNKDFVYDPRGFKNDYDHNDWLKKQITSLPHDALLVHLGDVGLSVGPDAIQSFMHLFPCETLMILGNHNSGVSQLYQDKLPEFASGSQFYPLELTHNITLMGYEFMFEVDGYKMFCRHMASLIWPEMSRNAVHLCGHSHGQLKPACPHDDSLGQILDVGIDNAIKYNNSAFFSIDEVKKIMNNKKKASLDHH